MIIFLSYTKIITKLAVLFALWIDIKKYICSRRSVCIGIYARAWVVLFYFYFTIPAHLVMIIV